MVLLEWTKDACSSVKQTFGINYRSASHEDSL